MTEQEKLIWAAGFFDGEGCVTVARARHKTTPHEYWQYTLMISLSQKRPEPLLIFQELFGGSFFRYQSQGADYFRWQLWSAQAVEVLRKLLPYLVVKFDIATLGVQFKEALDRHVADWRYKLQERDRRGRIRKQYYPAEVLAEREWFYQEARKLNARNRTNNREPKWSGPLETFEPKEIAKTKELDFGEPPDRVN